MKKVILIILFLIALSACMKNQSPKAIDDLIIVDEDGSVIIEVLDNDTDKDGDKLTIKEFTLTEHGTVTKGENSFFYTPNRNYNGIDSFTYTITDGVGGTSTATVTITVNSVNDGPLATDDTSALNEDSTLLINVLDNDIDIDGDTLTIIEFTQGLLGTVTKEGNNLRYTPNPNFNGNDSFTYKIDDGNEGVSTATVTITLVPINDDPEATDDTATLNEDNTVLIDVLTNDFDIDANTLNITGFTQASNGTVVLEGNSLRYTPNENFHGTDSFTYTIVDGLEGTSTATVTIIINTMNDIPEAIDDTATIDEDNTILIDVLANDLDNDNDTLSIIEFTQGTNGTVSQDGEKLLYTPNSNFNGTDSFTYTISDGFGGTTTATVTITIDMINDTPISIDDLAIVDEDSTVSIEVLTNDYDFDNDTLNIIEFTQGINGTVTQVGDSLIYTPNANFNGNDHFTYTISDGQGGTSSATVTITINPVNDAPVVNDDFATADEDSYVVIDVLLNDSDIDGNTFVVIGYANSSHGTVTQDGNGLRYTPGPNFVGSDSFTYSVSDFQGGVSTGTVTITVNPINDNPEAIDNTIQINEDSTVLIDVLANDSDFEGDTIHLIGFTQGLHGTVTQVGDSLRYTPIANFNGMDSFTYDVSDGIGVSTATVTITIHSINDIPVANDDTAIINEDGTVLIDILINDFDIDGDTLIITKFTQGSNGSVTLEGNSLRYTPTANFNGTDHFLYELSDGFGGITSATVTLIINLVNDIPVAIDDSVTIDEDGTVLIDILANDTDIDGDTLTIIGFTQGLNGSVTQIGEVLSYTPTANFHGTDSFMYEVSDGFGGTTTATVTITINPVNDAPVANDDIAVVDEDGTVLIDVLVNDDDVDGDIEIIIDFTQGLNGSVVQEGDSLRYTPFANFNGSDSFTYTISDGLGGTETGIVMITINPINDIPVAVDDNVTIDEDTTVLIDVLGNDTDIDSDTLTIIGFTQGSNGTVTHIGEVLSYTPTANFHGTDSFTYELSDGLGGITTATVTITINPVNDAPVANDDIAVVNEDAILLIDVLVNDDDVEGDTIIIINFTQGLNGSVVQEGDSLRYTPYANFNGSDSFTYTISDGLGGTETGIVTITINPINDTPVAIDDSITIDEDTTVLIDILANDTDIDGDTLSITGFTQGSNGSVSQEGYSLRYTPSPDFNGMDSFTYELSDGFGGISTATVIITINPINDAPVANDDIAVVNEDATLLIDVLINDDDIEGDTIIITGFTQSLNGFVVQEGDSLRYTPYANFNGSDGFTYTIGDGLGGTETGIVIITINPINDVPVAINDSVTIDEDTTVLIDVLANDTDIDGDTLSITGFTQGSNGSVSQEGYSLRYTPSPNFHGMDSFTYELSDGFGGISTATVIITINPINDAPVANDDIVVVNEDSTLLIDVLINDNDVEGDTIIITGFTQSLNGSVVQEGDSLRYTPYANFNGSDSFTYTIGDGHGGSETGIVIITINPINDIPVAINDSVTIDEDTTVLIDVLANDIDIDGDTLTISVITQSSNGFVTQVGDRFSYSPAANFNGMNSFTYKISDGFGGISTATVTITINPINDAPVANDDFAVVDEDGSVLINVFANDTDVDGDSFGYSDYTYGTNGSVTLVYGGLRYTPNENFNGVDTFTYIVGDGHGGTATAIVTVIINPINDAPVTNDDFAVVDEDDSVLINVFANDTDVDGDSLGYSNYSNGTNGYVSIEYGGLRYTPNENFNGIDTFTYDAGDGHGGITTAIVTITINPINDNPEAIDDFVSLDQNTQIQIDVIINDIDIDGDFLMISGFTQGLQGIVSQEGNYLHYIPNPGYVGEDSFTYEILDGYGGYSLATVHVSVLQVVILDMYFDGTTTNSELMPIEITIPGTYVLITSYYLAECDTILLLYESDQTTWVDTNDDYTDLYAAIIVYLDPGTYYVKVEDFYFVSLYCHLEMYLE